MKAHTAFGTAALVAILVLSGCIGPVESASGTAAEDGHDTYPTCVHPWPCRDGTEWPTDLEGPFALGSWSFETIEAEDGVAIRGWVFLPDVPEGVQVPVVLIPSPYWGNLWASPGTWPEVFRTPETDYLVEPLISNGYAVAAFSVRGTGVSDGCLPWYHEIEGRDMAAVATWLGAQDWSNGRVGATGISYEGMLNWFMAVEAPDALKTIVPLAATGPNLYTHLHTPQSAAVTPKWPYGWVYDAPVTVHGREAMPSVATAAADRLCPSAAERIRTHVTSKLSDERSEAFYAERDVTDRLEEITAAVWIVHNFNDHGPLGGGHAMEDDILWDALASAPKAMRIGWTGHLDPARGEPGFPVHSQDEAAVVAWHGDLIAWYDFWLKGIEGTSALDTVAYELRDGTPMVSGRWPPAETVSEVLYLADRRLDTSPDEGSVSFLRIPQPAIASLGYPMQEPGLPGRFGPLLTACEDGDEPSDGVAFVSEPMAADAVLAGNPMAQLVLSSDTSGGVVSAYLMDIGPEGACAPVFLAFGAANLRLHDSPFDTHGLEPNEPTPVRIDMSSVAHAVPAGHRLALVVGAGDAGDVGVKVDRIGRVAVVGNGTAHSSHIVVPFIEGTAGGAAPSIAYPVRPFSPEWYAASS